MKHVFCLFIVLLIQLPLIAQETERPLDRLLRFELMTKKQKKQVELALKQGNIEKEPDPFFLLECAEFSKLLGRPALPDFFEIGNFSSEGISASRQEKINAGLTEYLRKLLKGEYITQQVHDEFLQTIKENQYQHIMEMLPNLRSRQLLSDYMHSEDLLLYCGELHNLEILNDSNYQRVCEDIRNEKLEFPCDLLPYCNQIKLFDLSNYSSDTAIYIEQIYRETAQLHPDLTFTDFSYVIKINQEESSPDYTSYELQVKIKCQGRWYELKSFIVPTEEEYMLYHLGKLETRVYYQIFNEVLMDTRSPLRIHYVPCGLGNWQYGLVLLDQEHSRSLQQNGYQYLRVSYEDFRPSYTPEMVDTILADYRKIGLFDHLSDEEWVYGQKKAYQNRYANVNNFLLCFPHILYSFDVELENLKNPYEEMLMELSAITRDEFNPLEISDSFAHPLNDVVTVSFTLNGKRYSNELLYEGDWIDPEFFVFIRKVMEENDLKGRFYELYAGEDLELSVIYLYPEQREYLRKNGLIQLAEDQY